MKGLTYLGIAYGKEFDQQECQVYYEFLKEYSKDTFSKAVKNIIKKSKFLPKINELVEECENCKENAKIEIIEFMHKKGYFKCIKEYEKAVHFMTTGVVPKWLQEDINKYYKMMHKEMIEAPERLMLSD